MITADQEQRLRELTRVFLEENKKLNLSALRTEENCWHGNVLDSLPAVDLLQSPAPLRILDLGTGGGFPLLPLALCLPQHQFAGLDSVGKKIDAVERIAGAMNIGNLTTINGRAEELGRLPAHREQYDAVLARAVAPVNVLLEYAAPLIKVKGCVLLWKSLHIEQELQDALLAQAELSCHLEQRHEYTLPGDWGTRQILVYRKAAPTSGKYPREVGMPKKEPIQ